MNVVKAKLLKWSPPRSVSHVVSFPDDGNKQLDLRGNEIRDNVLSKTARRVSIFEENQRLAREQNNIR